MARGTGSISKREPEATVPSVASSHAKRNASGTTLVSAPMRTRTIVTRAIRSGEARSHTSSTIAKAIDASCTLVVFP